MRYACCVWCVNMACACSVCTLYLLCVYLVCVFGVCIWCVYLVCEREGIKWVGDPGLNKLPITAS